MSDDKPKKNSDIARRIWLAGIGAYGKAFEEGREMVRGLSDDLGGKTSDAFETLAEKGEALETSAKLKGMQLAGKASGLTEELQNTLAVDERIQAMRDRLSGGGDSRVAALEAQVAALEAKIEALSAAKPASKKRATTTRTKKAPAKKETGK